MLRKIVLAALVAGVAAGLVVTAVQSAKVWPLIHGAELFEEAAHAASAVVPAHDDEEWAPSDGVERVALTFVFNILVGVGFALMLNAFLALRGAAGEAIDASHGLLWGIAGFVVFAFAPALGLPPEAPGMPGADLLHRQLWWGGTTLATAAGLGAFVFGASVAWRIAGVALLIAPHIVGAPHLPHEAAEHASGLPAGLAAQYVSATLVATAIFWTVLGGVSGWMQRRLG